MIVLNLDESLMYHVHQNYIKKKYIDKPKLFFTDTDSLTKES